MKFLSEEKPKLVAERNGWSLAYAEGHVEGETMRRSGQPLSMYTQVGIDDYARGFRAGYFQRQNPRLNLAGAPGASEWNPKNALAGHVEVVKESMDYMRNFAR